MMLLSDPLGPNRETNKLLKATLVSAGNMSTLSTAETKIVQIGRRHFFLATEIIELSTDEVVAVDSNPILIVTEEGKVAGANRSAKYGIVLDESTFQEDGSNDVTMSDALS